MSELNELNELYQELLLDHSKRPHHHGPLDHADATATGHNPLCGDQITVYVRREGGRLAQISFTGQACAICTASASLMSHTLRGTQQDEVDKRITQVHQMLTEDDAVDPDAMGELGALGGVHRFPMRVKCATLPWHTLRAALRGQSEASTE
jgi:nitrogen fixation NifU-like protein